MKNFFLLLALAILFAGCSKEGTDASNASASGSGTGGSLARFTIVGNYLYVADNSRLQTFNISNPGEITQVDNQTLGFNIETIFPYKDKLFVGAETGLYLLSLANPAKPQFHALFKNLRSCDPVMANDAYVFFT